MNVNRKQLLCCYSGCRGRDCVAVARNKNVAMEHKERTKGSHHKYQTNWMNDWVTSLATKSMNLLMKMKMSTEKKVVLPVNACFILFSYRQLWYKRDKRLRSVHYLGKMNPAKGRGGCKVQNIGMYPLLILLSHDALWMVLWFITLPIVLV
jgi:hypothetical protein